MVSNISKYPQKAYTLVFGLTADPIHTGHEQVIHNSYAFAQQNGFEITEFLLVPTYQPNLIANKKQPRTAYKHRFAMCELTANYLNNKFSYQVHVTDIEKYLYLKTAQKSFSYDTLKALNKPKQLFVLSADHFNGRWPKFRKWHCWQALVAENGLLVHQRPGHGINQTFIEQLKSINPEVYTAKNMPTVEVSSTYIRQQLAKNVRPGTEQLNNIILDYISKHNLYQASK